MSDNKDDSDPNRETLKFVELFISGGVHSLPSVLEQPEATLARWRIARHSDGDHLVGHHVEECEGRVSTPIVMFDPKDRLCVTSSGRRYKLIGPPGSDRDAEYVYSRVYRRSESTDGTQEYWMAIESTERENK